VEKSCKLSEYCVINGNLIAIYFAALSVLSALYYTMDLIIQLLNCNSIISVTKWPYLVVSKTETVMNCYSKNVFFKLLIMLEHSMNRLDMVQSMVLNAGQVS
jgi:hypothetical protein